MRRFLTGRTVDAANTSVMLSLDELFQAYSCWASERNFKPMTDSTFASRVKAVVRSWIVDGERLFGLIGNLTAAQRKRLVADRTVHTKKGSRYPVVFFEPRGDDDDADRDDEDDDDIQRWMERLSVNPGEPSRVHLFTV